VCDDDHIAEIGLFRADTVPVFGIACGIDDRRGKFQLCNNFGPSMGRK
jgi:hypothetical protein